MAANRSPSYMCSRLATFEGIFASRSIRPYLPARGDDYGLAAKNLLEDKYVDTNNSEELMYMVLSLGNHSRPFGGGIKFNCLEAAAGVRAISRT